MGPFRHGIHNLDNIQNAYKVIQKCHFQILSKAGFKLGCSNNHTNPSFALGMNHMEIAAYQKNGRELPAVEKSKNNN